MKPELNDVYVERPDDDHVAFGAGQAARLSKLSLDACPYEPNTPKRVAWIAGWQEADMDAENLGSFWDCARLVSENERLRAIIKQLASYAYTVSDVHAGKDGPRVTFMCLICRSSFRSWKACDRHEPDCPLSQSYRPRQPDLYQDLPSCPRCDGRHDRLPFYEIGRPIHGFHHWAMCPETFEPILAGRLSFPESVYYTCEQIEKEDNW